MMWIFPLVMVFGRRTNTVRNPISVSLMALGRMYQMGMSDVLIVLIISTNQVNNSSLSNSSYEDHFLFF